MKMITIALMLVVGMVSAAAQNAAPQEESLTVYGIPFNEPFSIPECNWKSVRDWTSRDNKATKPEYTNTTWSDNGGICYAQAPINAGKPLADGSSVAILFPLKDRPSLGTLSVRVVDGRVAYMKIRTRGYRTQSLDFESLVEKFGEPINVERPAMQNRMSASFNAIHASWALPSNASAHYFSVIDALDEGQILISTPEGRAAEERAQEERRRSRPGTRL